MIFDHVRLHDVAFHVEPNLPFNIISVIYTTHLITKHNLFPDIISAYILLNSSAPHTFRYSSKLLTEATNPPKPKKQLNRKLTSQIHRNNL